MLILNLAHTSYISHISKYLTGHVLCLLGVHRLQHSTCPTKPAGPQYRKVGSFRTPTVSSSAMPGSVPAAAMPCAALSVLRAGRGPPCRGRGALSAILALAAELVLQLRLPLLLLLRLHHHCAARVEQSAGHLRPLSAALWVFHDQSGSAGAKHTEAAPRMVCYHAAALEHDQARCSLQCHWHGY